MLSHTLTFPSILTLRNRFKFMGDVKPQGSPFQINFPLLSERNDTNGIIPLNLLPNQCGPTTISRSNTSTTTTSSFNPHHCSCLDCQDSCPLLDDSIAEKVQACSFNGYSCSSIGFVSGFIAAITALVVMLLEINRSSHRDTRARRDRREGGGINYHIDDNEENESLLPQRQQLGSSSLSSIITSPLNSVIQHAFHNLGLFCSKYAYATILTAFVLIALTSLGWAFFFSVEIDPVKLWVAPTSQTAREKSYYDDVSRNYG